MKRNARMSAALNLKKGNLGRLSWTTATRSGQSAADRGMNSGVDAYLHEVADRFDLSPQEVLRRGVALFEIAAEAEMSGNSVVELDRDNVVVREYTSFREQTSISEPHATEQVP